MRIKFSWYGDKADIKENTVFKDLAVVVLMKSTTTAKSLCQHLLVKLATNTLTVLLSILIAVYCT